MPEVAAIDAHHHIWKYDALEHEWIREGMEELKRDFLPAQLKHEMDPAGVAGTVVVQARQSLEETEWLLGQATEHDFMRGVVGWVPLTDPDLVKHLERYAGNTKLKGVRHVIQDEPDDAYILRPDFGEGIRRLRMFGLVYDILIYERHLPQTIQFVDQHPNQIFVLDHIGKPRIKAREFSPWRENMRELARRNNVYCKLSGLLTMADWKHWTGEGLKPYFDAVLETFGTRRIMFGSDWPVLRLAGTYAGWTSLVRQWMGTLSREEQQRMLRATAVDVYHL